MIITLLIIWYIIGVCSIVYWATEYADFTVALIIPALIVGICGPIVYVLEYCLHNNLKFLDIVLFNSRKKY